MSIRTISPDAYVSAESFVRDRIKTLARNNDNNNPKCRLLEIDNPERGITLTSDHIARIIQAVNDNETGSSFRMLKMTNIRVDRTVALPLLRLLSNPKHTWMLIHFCCCRFSKRWVVPVFTALGTLSRLRILGVNWMDDDDDDEDDGGCIDDGGSSYNRAVEAFLLSNESLFHLELSSINHAAVKFAAAFASQAHRLAKNPTLMSLDLTGNAFDCQDMLHLARGIQGNRSLESINMTKCLVPDHGLAALLLSIRHNSIIKAIDLTSIQGFGQEASKALVATLHSDNEIGVLRLNSIMSMDFEFKPDLMRAISNKNTLQILCLADNHLEWKDIEPLFGGRNHGNLVVVDLSKNAVDVNRLLPTLSSMRSLKRMGLQQNPCTSETPSMVLEVLKVNAMINTIWISHNNGNDDDDIRRQLLYYGALNWGGRMLLSSDGCPLGLWPKVFHRIQNAFEQDYISRHSVGCKHLKTQDILFFMLRYGPILFQQQQQKRQHNQQQHQAAPCGQLLQSGRSSLVSAVADACCWNDGDKKRSWNVFRVFDSTLVGRKRRRCK